MVWEKSSCFCDRIGILLSSSSGSSSTWGPTFSLVLGKISSCRYSSNWIWKMPNLSAIRRAQVVLPAPWVPSRHTRKGGAYRKILEYFVTIWSIQCTLYCFSLLKYHYKNCIKTSHIIWHFNFSRLSIPVPDRLPALWKYWTNTLWQSIPVGKNENSLDSSGKSALLLPFLHLQKKDLKVVKKSPICVIH